jgi:hypothetical protein
LNSVGVKPEQTIQSLPHPNSPAARKQTLVLALFLVLITVALYARVNGYPFVNYDDTLYVTQNPHVQAGLTAPTIHWAFTTYHVGTWHPLTWMSHALDCQLFGLDPAGPHDVNLLLHVLNTVLLFLVLQRATGFAGRTFMVAALFALHPINVESVVWIAERKNPLSMVFFLLGLGAYRWYVSKPKADRYAVVALLFAFGLMSKPQVITFPCVLLLWDYWPLRRLRFGAEQTSSSSASDDFPARTFLQLLLEKVPLFLMAGVSAVITMNAQRADGNKVWYPLSLRMGYALISYVKYIGMALWPSHLAAFYPHPDQVSPLHVVLAALFLIAVTALVVAGWRRRPYLLVGWFFYLGTLVPMIGLEGVGYQGRQGIADRYAYLPFTGLFLMICWAAAEWAEQKHIAETAQRVFCFALLVILIATAYRQLGYWQDNVTLWSHTLQVTDRNFLAENNLGKALLKEGQVEKGVSHFYKAAAIYPSDPVANLNIGIYEQQRGNYAAAIEHYKITVAITRDIDLKAAALNNMAASYRKLGDFTAADQTDDAAAQLRH